MVMHSPCCVSSSYILYWLVILAGIAVASESTGSFTCLGSKYDKFEVFNHMTPYGNTTAGVYTRSDSAKTLHDCVCECVSESHCNVAFVFGTTCFTIACHSKQSCEPLQRPGKKFEKSYMVIVRIPDEWEDATRDFSEFGAQKLQNVYLTDALSYDDESDEDAMKVQSLLQKTALPSSLFGAESKHKTCLYGIDYECPDNEHCVPKNSRSRNGVCYCNDGYVENSNGRCVLQTTSTTASPGIAQAIPQIPKDNLTSTTDKPAPSTTPAPVHLVVSAGDNVTLHLPDNAVTLSAYALNPKGGDDEFKYVWTLISHPEGSETGTMQDQNTKTLKLSNLRAGVYTFKVTVTGNNAVGEATVNVTVLAPERPNNPPVAIIQPSNVTIKLPNKETVLDGSFSTDDDKITQYQWEVLEGPIGYSVQLNETPTLQLKNLIPGFYRFKLTVTDSKGASNFTFANVTVQKETDYPPTANANSEVVIYLPQNEVVLNGNLSTDDKGIKSWEWKKSPDTDKAVDMEGTNSPYLHLSQLEVGVYKFILKVTDTADQTSSTEVHLFVKPETNTPPTAVTGPDLKVTLPLKAPVLLDGSRSSDDIKIASYHWEQVQGPKPAVIADANASIAKATGLVPGYYQFKLTVVDDKKSNSSALLNVTVIQTQNMPPHANAGGDKSIYLPCDVVIMNGSSSTDDVGIVKYHWTRDSASLAAGIILEMSDNSPVLKLTGLIPGRYLFRLTVIDAQGASSSDTASLIVKSPASLMDQVEIMVNADIKSFTQEQEDTMLRQLEMLLHVGDPVSVKLIKLDSGVKTRRVVMVIIVEKASGEKHTIIPGTEVVYRLKKKLRTDNSLLDLEILSVDTVVCQNSCSGHGSCDQYTKRCICEAFWMQDIFRMYLGDRESNCDWSILYVIIISFIVVVLLAGVLWGLSCCCINMRFRKPRKRHRYMLLDDFAEREREREKFIPRNKKHKSSASSLMASDSESDAIFESQRLPQPTLKTSNGIPNGLVRDMHKVTA